MITQRLVFPSHPAVWRSLLGWAARFCLESLGSHICRVFIMTMCKYICIYICLQLHPMSHLCCLVIEFCGKTMEVLHPGIPGIIVPWSHPNLKDQAARDSDWLVGSGEDIPGFMWRLWNIKKQQAQFYCGVLPENMVPVNPIVCEISTVWCFKKHIKAINNPSVNWD